MKIFSPAHKIEEFSQQNDSFLFNIGCLHSFGINLTTQELSKKALGNVKQLDAEKMAFLVD